MSENIERKIDVKEFVKKYNTFNSKDAKRKYLESMIIEDKYVDYLVKVKYARDILAISCIDKDTGEIKMDSCKKYILYICTLINLYTKFEITSNKAVESYDLLDMNKLVDPILELMPEHEYKTFNTIFKMCQDDLMTNNYEIHGFINRKIKNAYPYISKQVSPLLNNLTEILNNLDDDKVINILKHIFDNK